MLVNYVLSKLGAIIKTRSMRLCILLSKSRYTGGFGKSPANAPGPPPPESPTSPDINLPRPPPAPLRPGSNGTVGKAGSDGSDGSDGNGGKLGIFGIPGNVLATSFGLADPTIPEAFGLPSE